MVGRKTTITKNLFSRQIKTQKTRSFVNKMLNLEFVENDLAFSHKLRCKNVYRIDTWPLLALSSAHRFILSIKIFIPLFSPILSIKIFSIKIFSNQTKSWKNLQLSSALRIKMTKLFWIDTLYIGMCSHKKVVLSTFLDKQF